MFPVVALALLTAANERHPALQTAALIAVVILVVAIVVLRPRPLAGGARALDRQTRPRVPGTAFAASPAAARSRGSGESFADFRDRALGLLARRWHVITVSTLAGHLTVFVLLLACLHVTGVTSSEVTVIEAFAAWALVRILGALPITPAGVGVVEVGLTGALVAFGAPNAEAVAATLLYRALTVLPTLALGLLALATWRTHHPGESIESPSDP